MPGHRARGEISSCRASTLKGPPRRPRPPPPGSRDSSDLSERAGSGSLRLFALLLSLNCSLSMVGMRDGVKVFEAILETNNLENLNESTVENLATEPGWAKAVV